ncbi:MAG: NAD(P)-dependent alcohol dehydrogenase [Planctomycetales bacterium]|nr:NAD(P)-dependent alcohol dehydrogenase [Planctomycetales bacterium]
MLAATYNEYGSSEVLHVGLRPMPRRGQHQLLIEVHASSVNPIDYRMRRGELKGILPGGFPRTPGYDVAGVVAAAPADSTYVPGDRVVAFLDDRRGGALAEYAVCSPNVAAKLPSDIPFEVAAAIPLAGSTALQSLRDHGHLQSGQRVLINGASGGVGVFAVQIAKAMGANVDAVASANNETFCLELGADRFFNYRDVDFTELPERWDLVFDAAGKSDYLSVRKVLTDHGRYVTTEPDAVGILTTLLTWPLGKSGRAMLAKPNGADLSTLIEMYQQGELRVVIDSAYALSEAAAAHRRVETGVDRGKVVVVNHPETEFESRPE